ncbi:MAG TPA: 6-phosphofructokinase [Chloroflexota bacterium]|nr:6-phosphofructokinase [Chloroflexota bacterium]
MARALRGKLLVGQSGGCTAVINASLVGVIEEASRHSDIEGVLGTLHGVEGVLRGELVDLASESEETLRRLRRTPSSALGSCRYKLHEGDLERIVHTLRENDVRYFLYIGGNDSADSSHKIANAAAEIGYDLRVMAVPKTIDNDLPITDHCPGYGSIARFVAQSTQDAGLDTEAMKRYDPVKIIEVMGRDAGWVAAASALGKSSLQDAPHLVYLPERTFDVQRVLEDVKRVHHEVGYVVVVLSETVRDAKGQVVGSEKPYFVDPFGHGYYESPAAYLCRVVARELGLRARFDKPGTIQRMSMALASPTDLEEAYLVGSQAVRYALQGRTDQMVILVRVPGTHYRCTTDSVPLEQIANVVKPLPPEFISPEGNFVTPAFMDYALPLIGGPLLQYARLAKRPI